MVRQTRKRKYTGQPMPGPPAGPPLPAGPSQAGLPPQVQPPAGPPQAQVQPPAGPPPQFQPPAGPSQQAPPPAGKPHVHPAQLVVTPPVAPQILVPQPQIQDMPIIEQIPPIDELPVQNPVQPPAIGFHLGNSIKSKILEGLYVDLGSLLEPSMDGSQENTLILYKLGQLQVQKVVKSDKITSISKWTDAFLVYISVYLSVHPEKTQDILKHMQIVRLGAARHGEGWKSYDEQFRLRMAVDPGKSWAVVDSELWLLCMGAPKSSFLNPPTLARKCFDYNYKRCVRVQCAYRHACIQCNMNNHPLRLCQRRTQTTNPRASGTVRGSASQFTFGPRNTFQRPWGPTYNGPRATKF